MRITGPGTWPTSRPRCGASPLIGWTPNGRADHLRSACDASLSRLRLDRIDLYLHIPDPAVPYAESIGALHDLQGEGEIRHPTSRSNNSPSPEPS